MATENHNELFSTLITDIKSYTGNDPLQPWLRGIRKMRDTLPRHVLTEKLPRFLQKCAQAFDSDRRYRNDLRFIRVWIQLMDYVDDPKGVLKTMETKKIGLKRSLFYQAYALYYEKVKKFDDADKMYRVGVQNLAEPLDELKKSYEQFIQRMEKHKTKKRREGKTGKRPLSDRTTECNNYSSGEKDENSCKINGSDERRLLTQQCSLKKEISNGVGESKTILKVHSQNEMPIGKSTTQCKLYRDDSVVAKFVDSAIVGRPDAEDACHHGLVEPTIHTKEALDAINSMFREPIEPANVGRKTQNSKPKADRNTNNGLEVFVDEKSDPSARPFHKKNEEEDFVAQSKVQQPVQEPFEIFVDDDLSNGSEPSEVQTSSDGSPSSSSKINAFVFVRPVDHHKSESSDKVKIEQSSRRKFREDTVVRRFVGSAILDDPEVENICHHGLVDPTVNLKEAMDDINNMFGKPIDFVRTTRRKRQEKAVASQKNVFGGFTILPDDELNPPDVQKPPQSSSGKENQDLFEPTVFTKEAMDDINDLFRMPLDF